VRKLPARSDSTIRAWVVVIRARGFSRGVMFSPPSFVVARTGRLFLTPALEVDGLHLELHPRVRVVEPLVVEGVDVLRGEVDLDHADGLAEWRGCRI
jgi:hypothetical protein